MMEFSIADLRELVRYDPATGYLYWKPRAPKWFSGKRHFNSSVASWNAKYAGKRADTVKDDKGYPITVILRRKFLSHRLAFAIHYGRWPTPHADHIDGDRANNRIGNLREADHRTNGRNLGLSRVNRSGVMGVFWRERYQRWVASIRDGSKTRFLGHFTEKDAAIAARQAAEAALGFHANHGARPAWSDTVDQHSNTPPSLLASDRDGVGSQARAASRGVNAGTERGLHRQRSPGPSQFHRCWRERLHHHRLLVRRQLCHRRDLRRGQPAPPATPAAA